VSIEERCATTAQTELEIGDKGAFFNPPPGWIYANLDSGPIALGRDEKSLISITLSASTAPNDVIESLTRLTIESQIDQVRFDALEKRLAKPQSTSDAGGTPIALWEIDKSTQTGPAPTLRGKGDGTLLVFVAPFAADRVLVGLGFAVVPDAQEDAALIMQAVQSVRGHK
jgi:hypothetical protein